jgi:hypothetical protein
MMITKSPVTKFKPWIYAVLCSPLNYGGLKQEHSTHPRSSFPARGCRTYLVQLRGKTSVSQSFVFVHDVFAVFAVFAVDVAVGL